MDLEVNKNSTSKTIYYILKNDIINLHLAPGTGISEKEISEKYQVSRTPVREAFVRLSQEDLLSIYPQKGTIVSLIDLSSVEEARFLRENLEVAVMKLACKEFMQEKLFSLEMNLKFQQMYMESHNHEKSFEADEDFHKQIFEGCNKIRTWSIIQNASSDFQRIRVLRLLTDFKWDNIYTQHVTIVDAIKNKNEEVACKVMKEHLNMVTFDKAKLKEKYPAYFK